MLFFLFNSSCSNNLCLPLWLYVHKACVQFKEHTSRSVELCLGLFNINFHGCDLQHLLVGLSIDEEERSGE